MAADLDLVRRLVAGENGLAIVATTRADGSVHSSLVNAGVLETDPTDGGPTVAMVIRGNAVKLDHFARTGTATVTFRVGWQWVSVDGPVAVIGPDAHRRPAAAAARRVHRRRRHARGLGRVRPGDGRRASGRGAGHTGQDHRQRGLSRRSQKAGQGMAGHSPPGSG